MEGGRTNNGRGAGNSGGRRRGAGGRGVYNNQGYGGRGSTDQKRGYHHQPPAPRPQQWVTLPPAQGHSGADDELPQQGWVDQQPVQGHPIPGVSQKAWTRVQPRAPPPSQHPLPPQAGGLVSGMRNPWTGSPRGPSPAYLPSPGSSSSASSSTAGERISISQKKFPSTLSESKVNPIQTIKRPDQGGKLAVRSIKLLVNHFCVNFDLNKSIIHYDVDVKPLLQTDDTEPVKKAVRKSDKRIIRDKLFRDDPDSFSIMKTAYDGEKNIFSSVLLPTGKFEVQISDGEEVKMGTYVVTIKHVNELKLSKLSEYLMGSLSYIPRDILQGMDLVMKENPTRQRICVGGGFYSSEYRREDDLRNGVAAYTGFQQSLKPTSQGLVLCLDYAVLAFHKPMPVIDYLLENLQLASVDDIKQCKPKVVVALKGLKVRVTHRRCKQKFTIAGLAVEDTCDSYFELVDPVGNNSPQRTSLVSYFLSKWNREIEHKKIPCLLLNKSNKVPMEFCILVEGQRYPKEELDADRAKYLKDLSLPTPWQRKDKINELLQAKDGPCGETTRHFGFGVEKSMTNVTGRVIDAPELKIGGFESVKVDGEKCQWNLAGRRSLFDTKTVERWALLNFTSEEKHNSCLQVGPFINNLKNRCRRLGMRMESPILVEPSNMGILSSVPELESLLRLIVDESRRRCGRKLQMIVCVMSKKHPGYKHLKWISETKVGVLTQCCLSQWANQGRDQNMANFCLKINSKLGGSNFELKSKLPHFGSEDHVMFVGADVNHPGANNVTCPSIAAVVGTVNWPAANRYVAKVSPQPHQQEKISNFGNMCKDLVNAYEQANRVKPSTIVVFRDGVSEGQFEMALTEELLDLKNAIYEDRYQPRITLIVAQKRHQTRLFVENKDDGGISGNVPPGTVVDTKIVHPLDFDFYLCSHYGGLGTSKPTHYYVLWDENSFTSDELQKLIYDMCYTFARCTKPVSLVPPVYYADIVAFRGRMFQEAAMEAQAHGTSSCYGATTSSSTPSSRDLFDKSFYRLHSDMEGIMFFL